jgi:acetyl-CoA C-acetyltransferase
MGNTGEVVATRYGVTREQQDEYALNSHRKAAAAMKAGKFKDEILPIEIPQKKAQPSCSMPMNLCAKTHRKNRSAN